MASLLKENRKFLRFPVSVPVHLDKKNDDDATICTNISQKGLLLETIKKLKKGEMVCLHLNLNPKGDPVKVLGEIMWAKKTGSTNYTNKPVLGFGVKFRANVKNSLNINAGILEKERWKPNPEKDFPEFKILSSSSLIT